MNRYRVNTNCNNMSRNSRAGRMRAGAEETKYVLDTAGCRVYDAAKDAEKDQTLVYVDLAACITKNKEAVDAMINKDSCACASDSKGAITAAADIKYPVYAGLTKCTDSQGTCYKAALDACVKSKSTTCKLKNMSTANQAIFYSLIGVAGLVVILAIYMSVKLYRKGAKVNPESMVRTGVPAL